MIMIDLEEVPEFYQGYVKKLKEGTIVETLKSTGEILSELICTIPESNGEFAYDQDKWSIKEVIQHIIDTERVFSYRALRFARMDMTNLSGFEQNDYVPASRANNRSLETLANEFRNTRKSTIDLYQSFDTEMMRTVGTANGFPFTVEAVGYITSGHCLHHTDILKERYLNAD